MALRRRAVLATVLSCALAAGCPGKSSGPRVVQPVVAPTGKGAARPPARGGEHGPGTAAPAVASGGLSVAGAACPTHGCAFHPGEGAYFACLSGGAGACFHFGARCAPADACMFDPTTKLHKHCDEAVEGTCQRYGAACTPAIACAFNSTDGLHHSCAAWAAGACTRWGALCAP